MPRVVRGEGGEAMTTKFDNADVEAERRSDAFQQARAAKIRRIAQAAYGEDCGHDNFRVVDESVPEAADDYTDGGYWVTARVWVPLSWVKASKP